MFIERRDGTDIILLKYVVSISNVVNSKMQLLANHMV